MQLTFWMYQGTAHYGVARIANSMRGVQAVFHAPQGDDYVNTIFAMLERTPNLPPMHTSVVSGRDLSQGSIRLPETLHQIESATHPELIIVVPSCSTALLQEDLHRVSRQAGLQTDLLVYDVNPYRVQEIAAADGLFTQLVQRYARGQPPTPMPSVNLLGWASLGFHARSDLICLRRMMATLGVHIHVVAPWGARCTDLEQLPAAWVNIAPYRELGQNAARFLEQQFGIPALTDTPLGVQPTHAWLHHLVTMLNDVGERIRGPSVTMPRLSAFSLDGLSAPSSVPWFARTADMESFSRKQVLVFGDATHTVGVAKFLHDELGMHIAAVGTYLPAEAQWIREQLAGYSETDLFVTERFQEVAAKIAEHTPDLVCGTQMERHSSRKLDVPCMVIAPPTHIENHLLGYYPMLGFDGADVIADRVYTSTKLGMEKHLIDLFGDAGLEYPQRATVSSAADQMTSERAAHQPSPIDTHLDPAGSSRREATQDIIWTPEAEAMLKKVPFFVRGKARKNTEKFAKARGYHLITVEVFREAKEAIGG